MDDPITLSALQHVAYCPRQFALIHVEQAWEENYFTAHGRILHERVDAGAPEQRGNVRYERSVSVFSQTLGITGKLDLLEIEGKSDNRIGKGGAHIDLAGVSAARIARAPALDGDRFIDHFGGRRITRFERGEIDEQLPRRTRLTHRIGRAIIVRGDVIGPPDQGQHCAVTVHADQRALCSAGHVVLDRGGRRVL